MAPQQGSVKKFCAIRVITVTYRLWLEEGRRRDRPSHSGAVTYDLSVARKNAAAVGLGRKGFQDPTDTSDDALARLLKRLKDTANPVEIRHLADQIERAIFHIQARAG
jgi:hypothetical protein